MNGPHCPKCGSVSEWAWYAGPENNPDAQSCAHVDVVSGLMCGYIYWRRNVPADATDEELTSSWRVKAQERRMLRAAVDRRSRVRALVHSILLSPSPSVLQVCGNTPNIVKAAVSLDDEIEALTNIQGRDS